jgi:hypothetical protein
MPRSEVHLDARDDLRRTRIAGFSDSVVGVRFVDGVAFDPMPQAAIERLRGIGLPIEDVGPWEAAEPVLSAAPTAGASVADAAEVASNAPADPGPRATRKRITP